MKQGWGCQPSSPRTSHGGLRGLPPPLYTLSSSVLLTAPLRLTSVSSETSAGRRMLGGVHPLWRHILGVSPPPLTHAGEVQHGSAHGHPAGLPEIRNPDLQQGVGARHRAKKGWILLAHQHPPFHRPHPCWEHPWPAAPRCRRPGASGTRWRAT